MPTTFTFLTFEQWKQANPDVVDIEDTCDECGGDGMHTCDCGDTHDCGYCSGTGKIKEVAIEDIYNRQLAKDKAKLEKYLNMVTVPVTPEGAVPVKEEK
jgi:RecJ-like exonuclease